MYTGVEPLLAPRVLQSCYSMQFEDKFPKKERNFFWESRILLGKSVVMVTWKAQILLCWEKLVVALLFLLPVKPL